jgi:hypothetical protein
LDPTSSVVLVPKVIRVGRGLVVGAKLDTKGLKENKEFRGPQELGLKEDKELKGPQELGLRVTKVTKVILGFKEFKELKGPQDLELKGTKVFRVTKVISGLKGIKEQLELDTKGLKAFRGELGPELKACKVISGLKDSKARAVGEVGGLTNGLRYGRSIFHPNQVKYSLLMDPTQLGV